MKNYFYIVLICASLLLASCIHKQPVEVPQAPKTAAPVIVKPAEEKLPEVKPTPAPVVVEEVKPTPAPVVVEEVQPILSWDNIERRAWSKTLLTSIDKEWVKLSKANDMGLFCPKYSSFSEGMKKIAFAETFIAIAFYESAWSPVSRMQETTMGKDPITGKPVYSEGLFQLSYQDEQWIKCGFDWSKDKALASTSPLKTILNPHLNIDCAVRIMSRQIASKSEIALKSGVYWAVIKENGKYEKITEIAGRVKKALPLCK